MDVTLRRNFIDTRSSRGLVKSSDSTSTALTNHPVTPPNDYNILDRMVRNDEVISTAFDTTVDMVSRNGYDFVSKTEKNQLTTEQYELAKERFVNLNFSEVLDNIVYSMLYYGDAFLELRYEGDTISELHVLETTEMRIVHDRHGEIQWYVQRPFDMGGLSSSELSSKEREAGIWFPPDTIIHFTMKKVGSQVYSQTPLEPVGRVWSTKISAHAYLFDAFRNLPPELMMHLKGANKVQQEDFMSMLQRRKQMPGFIPVTFGSENSALQIEQTQFNPAQSLLEVLEYLREAVLMITRVPPVWIGLVNSDGANRGNSEAQIFSFETRIRKIQQKIQDKLNRELMPKLSLDGLEFNFNPISSKDEKDVVQNAAVMKSMLVKPEAIVRYLKRNGITDIEVDDFIDPIEQQQQMMEAGNAGLGGGNQTSRNQLSPSRKPSDKDSMKSNLGRTGVSEDGAAKTEEKNAKLR